jgi:UDP-glucuronate decarboxylase
MDTVLVIGGAGAVGSQLCSTLYAAGHEVLCMDIVDPNNAYGIKHLINKPRFKYVRHSATHQFRANCKYIYNFASLTDSVYANQEHPVEAMKTEWLGMMNTLEVARQNGATVIYGSSSSFYAYQSGRYDVAFPGSHIKTATESLCYSYQREYDVDVRVARLFEMYGPGMNLDDQRVIPRMVVAALQNSDIIIRDSRSILRTFCWTGDAARGIVALAESNRYSKGLDVVNFGGNEPITLEELARKIVAMTHSHSRIIPEPCPNRYVWSKIADIELAERRLGWRPEVTLDEGLSRMIELLDKRLKIEASIYKCESWIEFY